MNNTVLTPDWDISHMARVDKLNACECLRASDIVFNLARDIEDVHIQAAEMMPCSCRLKAAFAALRRFKAELESASELDE